MTPSPDSKAPGLEVLIENLPGNVYRRVRRPNGSYYFEFLSRGLFRRFDIDNERLLREDPIRFDWIHSEDRARFVADLEISAATLGLLDHRVRVVGANGSIYWARGVARPSRRPNGEIVWDGVVIDVTREVEAEAALRIAKDEADRAHQAAARTVADVGARLSRPVAELGRLLERMEADGAANGRTLIALRAAQAEMTTLLAGLASDVRSEKNGRALTKRQQEVLRLVAEGLSNKAISARLDVAPGTVKLHVAAILRALGARTRRDLRARAFDCTPKSLKPG